MTQKNVELVIGRLVTDEEFRRGFRRDPQAALAALLDSGIELNRVERDALLSLDAEAFERLAPALSLRLQRAALHSRSVEEDGRRS
jgi:hypothetical protein